MVIRLLPVFILAVLLFTGCSKDEDHEDEHNHITISIVEPTNNKVIADASNVHVHVKVEAEVENHEVEIILYQSSSPNDLIIDYDLHDHDKVIEFEQDVDLSSYASGTSFVIKVQACEDHDCAEKEEANVTFSLE